jgi:hypothetical protein
MSFVNSISSSDSSSIFDAIVVAVVVAIVDKTTRHRSNKQLVRRIDINNNICLDV